MTRPTILDLDLVVVPREATLPIVSAYSEKQDEYGISHFANARVVYPAMLSASPYPTAWDDVRKYVEGLERSNEMWRRNSIDTKAAMTAMRNDINQHVPLPSLDSDLLQGPENSVFCATVASAVAARIAELEKRLADAERVIEPFAAVAEFDIGDDEYDDDVFRPITAKNARVQLINVGHLRAALAYMDGK